MPYVTNAERIGEKRGRKDELLSMIKNAKKEGVSAEITSKLTGLDAELVKKIMNNEETDIPLHLLDK